MKGERLQSVDAIRALRRRQVADAREAALSGAPFAITNSDEAEEIFTAMGVGVQVINSFNFIILSEGKGRHFTQVLNDHGFPGRHFFALGYASTLAPDEAPWGGLPRPAIVVGSTRDEAELRVTELWARAYGCAFYPLDFNMASPGKLPPQGPWWDELRTGWDRLVDPDRLDLRVAQMRGLIARVEELTGKSFSIGELERLLERCNSQMDDWMRVCSAIASASQCPVTLRDQLAAYQMMWSRGSDESIAAIRAYAEEVEARAAAGSAAYGPLDHRVFLADMNADPPIHAYMVERHRAGIVGCPYTTVPASYARDLKGDALRALAARNLFLFAYNDPAWWVAQTRMVRADCALAIEKPSPHPSVMAKAMNEAGIPFLSLASGADDEANRAAVDRFFATRRSSPA